MIYQELELWNPGEYDGKHPDCTPRLCTYILDQLNNQPHRPAVLVLPGGSYQFTSEREGEPIATAFNRMGYQAFVLHYSIDPNRHPQPLRDVTRALCMIRDNADQWMVDSDRVAVIGFSAGGHLAGSIATLWNQPYLQDVPGMAPEKNKPNAVIMSYPVINPASHMDSFRSLLGDGMSNGELVEHLTLEKQVSENTPPIFLWHTFEDDCVNVEGVMAFATALRAHMIPFELHIYPKGGHGLSLAVEEMCEVPNPHVATWIDLCQQWLEMTL